MYRVASLALPRKATEGHTLEDNRSSEWTPPLVRHYKPHTNQVDHTTLRVRALTGDVESDFIGKFPPGPLFAEAVCRFVSDRLGVPEVYRSLFALWIVGRDLEIQVKPNTNIFQLVHDWSKLVVKYTHYPQAMDKDHYFNRHWFVFRREATITREIESNITDESVTKLLYGEARRNVLHNRYSCTFKDSVRLAALQLQIALGNYDPLTRPSGYFAKNPDFFKSILPSRFLDYKSPTVTEERIINEYKKLEGLRPHQARVVYLNYARTFRCYGCSFFPVCHEPPPAGFFEFRIQRWHAGIGPEGIVVFEKSKGTYHFIESWDNVKWIHSEDTFVLYENNPDTYRPNKFRLISPQAHLMHNLSARLAYLYENKDKLPSRIIPPPKILPPALVDPAEDLINKAIAKKQASKQASIMSIRAPSETPNAKTTRSRQPSLVPPVFDALTRSRQPSLVPPVFEATTRSRQPSLAPPASVKWGGKSPSFVSAVEGVKEPIHEHHEDDEDPEMEAPLIEIAIAVNSSTADQAKEGDPQEEDKESIKALEMNETVKAVSTGTPRKRITPLSSFQQPNQQFTTPRNNRSRAPSVLVSTLLNNLKQNTTSFEPTLQTPKPNIDSQTPEEPTASPLFQKQHSNLSTTSQNQQQTSSESQATQLLESFIPPALVHQLSESIGFKPSFEKSPSFVNGGVEVPTSQSRSSSVEPGSFTQIVGRRQNEGKERSRAVSVAMSTDTNNSVILRGLSELARGLGGVDEEGAVDVGEEDELKREAEDEVGDLVGLGAGGAGHARQESDASSELLDALQEELDSLTRLLEAPLVTVQDEV
ncbi:Krev interaction trapped protein 1 [Chytridiales sp. JEL 0842]|nr:Krev interaction trapped protein 1 [Chytridiales sp. JEL 0842]